MKIISLYTVWNLARKTTNVFYASVLLRIATMLFSKAGL